MKTAKPRKSRFQAVDEAIRAMVKDAPPPSPELLDTLEHLKKAEPCDPKKVRGGSDAD